MIDGLLAYFDDAGIAHEYDPTYDITIHCESEEKQKMVYEILQKSIHIPTENRSNGDVVEEMLPIEEKWTCYNRLMNGNEVCVRFSGTTDISFFSKEWWDSPFKGKSQS